jgi:serine/threonine kinase PknH
MGSGPSDDAYAGTTLGPYRLEERLGEGGSGLVYRARRLDDGRLVALKVLKNQHNADPDQARRFVREARAAGSVAHPNLIEVLDAGDVEGRRYLAMPYVAGRSLADRLAAEGPLPVEGGMRIVAQVAAAVDALHAAGLVHRDIKPSNVLLDADRGAVLTDFGLVKSRDYSALTRPGQMVGTLQYLAPEVLRGSEPGPAADCYAVGCVAYECLAGAPPFAGLGMFALGMAILDQEPGDPCAARDDAPPGLGALVCAALAKDPAARPQSVAAYARMLRVATRSA